MPSTIEVQSHIGSYRAHFVDDGPAKAAELVSPEVHFIVDARVAELYRARLAPVLAAPSVLLLDADETTKSLERMPSYVDHLVRNSFKRNHRLIGIGGGVMQDITCFLAATMMRGVDWMFFPTTLLAQADSCIGSKSSINVGEAKNIMGTFTPPREIFIDVRFLRTLDKVDVRSGVGEILKVHAIAGPDAFDRMAVDYDAILSNSAVMEDYVYRALSIKKPYIELDEFDRKERQVFNYGHSFGHAIESATNFAIPHGIAVTMGMDIANFVARHLALSEKTYDRMHGLLRRNYLGFENEAVPLDRFCAALARDKKNSSMGEASLILPDSAGQPTKKNVAIDGAFKACCTDYFQNARLV